jgi:hypothetical protein
MLSPRPAATSTRRRRSYDWPSQPCQRLPGERSRVGAEFARGDAIGSECRLL